MSPKILLVRKFRAETRARSAVVTESGFYWRDFGPAADLADVLRSEKFSLIIFDHRGLKEDPLPFVEPLCRLQSNTPTFLVSEPLELENIVRAIRLGVKDLFHPPLNLGTLIERIQSELGTTRGARLERW